jgi:hypothetical protein
MVTKHLLPPSTLGERLREVRMRLKAFYWWVRKIRVKQGRG